MYALIVVVTLLIIAYLARPDVQYHGDIIRSISGKPVTFLLWTGGYDSTHRLLQLLLIYQMPVQPVYISAKNTDGFALIHGRRDNRNEERNAMYKIIDQIQTQYPYTRNLILPMIDVHTVRYPPVVYKHMHTMKTMGHFHRIHSQYGAFATVSRKLNIIMDQCAENGPNTYLGKAISGYVVPTIHNQMPSWIISTASPQYLSIFDMLRFPLIKMTKHDMLEQARDKKFDHILALTFSCWQPINGAPCNHCEMCESRII